jgi:hypothetical protein
MSNPGKIYDTATSRCSKEERHGVFVDYNQNAKDRTVASAYSVRPVPQATVSAPPAWDEVPECDPDAFTITTVPARLAHDGDPWERMDDADGSPEQLLEVAERDQRRGHPDAPWPPHFAKQEGDEPRVQPSKRRSRPAPGTAGERAVARAAPGKSFGASGRRRTRCR